MANAGWKALLKDADGFKGEGRCPIQAYSEYLPPPRPYWKPYEPAAMPDNVDLFGWPVTPYEEAIELKPGFEHLASQFIKTFSHLGRGEAAHGLSRTKLSDNPFWPANLAEKAGTLRHERYVIVLSLALSRTQDDKGRVRWTLFGGSEHGPAKAFWQGFWRSPKEEAPPDQAVQFFRELLHKAYGQALGSIESFEDVANAGVRILPDANPLAPHWRLEKLPSWTERLLLKDGEDKESVKYLLTFRPFGQLPPAIQESYLAGHLHLIPFPGSLIGWGVPSYHNLREHLPFADQLPLLQVVARHEAWPGMRVPQAGWMHEPRPGIPDPGDNHGPVRNAYRRTHRWAKLHRHQDELAVTAEEDQIAHVLFSCDPHDLGLYGKPMGRNAQIWTKEFKLVLDGPRASAKELSQAAYIVKKGGLFGYRFQFPAMRVGRHEIYWQRPLVAVANEGEVQAFVLEHAPLGYFTAYQSTRPDLHRPIELWPRIDFEESNRTAAFLFNASETDRHPKQDSINSRKILQTWETFGKKLLPRAFARQMLTVPSHHSLEEWLASLPAKAELAAKHANHYLPEFLAGSREKHGKKLAEALNNCLEPANTASPPESGPGNSLTFHVTAKRSYEVEYWKLIAHMAEGQYRNKDNADCVRDPITQSELEHHQRDLEALGDFILDYYRKLITAHRMKDKALVGDLPFKWQTDFDFSWMGGWLKNQHNAGHERNLMVVIPGKDRKRAVIMADHYDTAYMADRYDPEEGGTGARLAANGADDNHSATAALMLGAPLFLELSKAGKLDCDIWLIHLTGEEFPSDCLGARHLCQSLIESRLKLHLANGKTKDFSKTRIQGVYVLDMVAHNNDKEQDIFQISPGVGKESLWLAYQAHVANQLWNLHAGKGNNKAPRKGKKRGKRSPSGKKIPAMACYPTLRGEIRLPFDPRSTLYNTDGQIFSDAGIPVVLFMENYDIDRQGYHDTHDTMENIDLDYGAALSAICIESVARAATQEPGDI